MRRIAVVLGLWILGFGCMVWPAGRPHPNPTPSQSWTGVVSDSHCGLKHSKPGNAATQCVGRCVSSGAKYALVSGDKVYGLDAQEKFVDYAGKLVKVTGALKGNEIAVSLVEPIQ